MTSVVRTVANLINILRALITTLVSLYGQFSSQYDSRVVNYDRKVLYKIDHWKISYLRSKALVRLATGRWYI